MRFSRPVDLQQNRIYEHCSYHSQTSIWFNTNLFSHTYILHVCIYIYIHPRILTTWVRMHIYLLSQPPDTDLAIFRNLFLPCTLLSDCLAWRHFIHGSSWYSKEGLKWYTSISYIRPDEQCYKHTVNTAICMDYKRYTCSKECYRHIQ